MVSGEMTGGNMVGCSTADGSIGGGSVVGDIMEAHACNSFAVLIRSAPCVCSPNIVIYVMPMQCTRVEFGLCLVRAPTKVSVAMKLASGKRHNKTGVKGNRATNRRRQPEEEEEGG